MKQVFLMLVFGLCGQFGFSQDTNRLDLSVPPVFEFDAGSISFASVNFEYAIKHFPSKEDTAFCEKHAKLIAGEPTKKNYADYYSLAVSLWQLNRVTEAEKLFLEIVASEEPYYNAQYYHASDVPADQTNEYGYGSYTSHYKNGACLYLAKIYIEAKQFEQALGYVEQADKKYVVGQNCGTGYAWYRDEIEGLYGLCYEGLERYDNIISLFLPEYDSYRNGILIRALKKTYSQAEITAHLKTAEESIVCVVDEFESKQITIENYGAPNEKTTEVRYTSGVATMNLFGVLVTLPPLNLKAGETASKELYAEQFKESGFYLGMISH